MSKVDQVLKIAVGQTQLIDLNRLGQSGFSPFGSPSVVSYIKIILQKSYSSLFLIQYIKINIFCEKVLLRTNFRSDLLTQCRLFVEAVTD